jgi:AcrR family transcriptional regulator
VSDQTTRDQIVEAADDLFYRRGYEHTSFADIADVVRISRGNFYYHFKSKDEILDAVIRLRLANTKRMLEQWEGDGKEPADRIRSFIHILIANKAKITRYGCPVGTLCAELAKLNHGSQAGAKKLFTLFRVWLRRQFALLGRPQPRRRHTRQCVPRRGIRQAGSGADVRLAGFMCRKCGAARTRGNQNRCSSYCLDSPATKDRLENLRPPTRNRSNAASMTAFFCWSAASSPTRAAGSWVSLSDLQNQVNDDPFVAEDIVSAENPRDRAGESRWAIELSARLNNCTISMEGRYLLWQQ